MSQDDTDEAALGAATRNLRRSIGWSQQQLATEARCAISAVSDLERSNNGTVELLERLTTVMQGRWIGLPRGRSLSHRVALARQRAGLSFATLADLGGVSKGAVMRLEQGAARVATLQAVLPHIAPRCTVRRPDFRVSPAPGQDIRFTPPDVLAKLSEVLGPIGLDPCGHRGAFVEARKMFTEADDGLRQPWLCPQGWVFVNPPFSNAAGFVLKGLAEQRAGRAGRLVFLLKGQTHGRLLHDTLHPVADLLLLRDRVGFVHPDGRHMTNANFGVVLAMVGIPEADVGALADAFPCIHIRKAEKPE